MAGEVNPGYSLSNLSKVDNFTQKYPKYIEFKNADGKIIKISVKPFETEEARKSLISFLGQYYDNGDKGSIKKDGKLQSGELNNLTKDLDRNDFINEDGELEITEEAIEKITYCIEEKGQKPGIHTMMRKNPNFEKHPKPITMPPKEKISAWSSMPAKQALKQEILKSAEKKSSPDKINFIEILEKFIKEEALKEKGQKQNIDNSIPDLKQDKLQDQDKVFILRFMQYLIETTPKYEIKLKFERFTEELERFKI